MSYVSGNRKPSSGCPCGWKIDLIWPSVIASLSLSTDIVGMSFTTCDGICRMFRPGGTVNRAVGGGNGPAASVWMTWSAGACDESR